MVIDLFSSYPSIAQWLVMLLVAGTLGYVLHYILSRKKWARSFRSMESRIQALEFKNSSVEDLKQQQNFLFESNHDLTEKLNEHDHLLKLQKKGKKGEKLLNAPNFVLLSDFHEYTTQFSSKDKKFRSETHDRLTVVETQHAELDLSQLQETISSVQHKQNEFETDNHRQDKEIEALRIGQNGTALKATPRRKNTPTSQAAPKTSSGSGKRTSLLQNLSIRNIKANESNKDDLKLIKGVGPFIEKKMNTLEIYSFEQLSQLTDDDIEAITVAIEFFPGRIQRDDWKSQAQKLMKKKAS